ncbi:MAG: hypothetical protein LBV30_00960 [Propionibacteriaceae bacterium]|jgi:hypothetical protein|nr:hypothetical protein [Propionibacteriaceae bacterium]
MTTIATIDPLPLAVDDGPVLSEHTGEPVRTLWVWVIIGLSWLSAGLVAIAFAAWWWQCTKVAADPENFWSSARLIDWTRPNPVSAGAIALVIAVAAMTCLMVAAAGVVAYNTWAGAGRWVRVAALIAVAVQGLSFLLTWWFSAAMIPLALAAVLLWLPPSRGYFDTWRRYRLPLEQADSSAEPVRYGRQSLYVSSAPLMLDQAGLGQDPSLAPPPPPPAFD